MLQTPEKAEAGGAEIKSAKSGYKPNTYLDFELFVTALGLQANKNTGDYLALVKRWLKCEIGGFTEHRDFR